MDFVDMMELGRLSRAPLTSENAYDYPDACTENWIFIFIKLF